MSTDVAIAVREVKKTYAEGVTKTPALNGVTLDVRRGELTLMMGPSGSGKTTLLSIMGCILRPSEGKVMVAGEDVTKLQENRMPRVRLKHIGFVFQGFNLFPTLTAGENVQLSLELKGYKTSQVKQESRQLLEAVGLADKYDEFPQNLSGGQKQRIAVARAVAGSPDVILADEPTAALDSHSGRTVMELLKKLAHTQKRGVVVVTHDNRVTQYADRIVRIEDGLVVEQ